MKYLELLFSLVLGLILFPIVLLILWKIGIGILAFPISLILYYLGGYFLGKKMATNKNLVVSILMGIGPLILILIFLFPLGWIYEGDSYLFILFPLLIIYLSYLGVKRGRYSDADKRG